MSDGNIIFSPLWLSVATEHAHRGLDLDVGVWQSHQWYAVALGSRLKHEGTQKKITAGHEYKVNTLPSCPSPLAPPPPNLDLI